MAQAHRLFKSLDDRILFGVAGGVAEYFDIDPVLVRVGWVALAIVTGGIAGLVYVLMALVMPKDPNHVSWSSSEDDSESDDRVPEDVHTARHRTRNIIAACLIFVGVAVLLSNLGIFGRIRWDIVWPVVIIALGLTILIPSFRR